MTPEGLIKREIQDYLEARNIFHWVNQAGRIPGRTLSKTGVSDLLGCFEGKLLAIEVKSEKGKLSDEQNQFLLDVKFHGGIGFMARSVEDVRKQLE